MSEVEVYQPATLAPVSGAELDVIVRQAELLSQSTIIPRDYRGKPANIVVAAMTGRTFGWDPMTAMRNGHVIEGTWSIKPEAMLALVRRAGHSVTGETTPEGARVLGRRGDTGDEMTVMFNLADARRAGLANKNSWKQYPQSMCWARAVAQLCRMLFADVTLGLSYTPEELGADVDDEGSVLESRPIPAKAQEGPFRISPDNAKALRERCDERGLDVANVLVAGTEGRTDDPDEVYTHEISAIKQAIDTASEAQEKVYAPDDPERPFTEDESPYPDPDTGEPL